MIPARYDTYTCMRKSPSIVPKRRNSLFIIPLPHGLQRSRSPGRKKKDKKELLYLKKNELRRYLIDSSRSEISRAPQYLDTYVPGIAAVQVGTNLQIWWLLIQGWWHRMSDICSTCKYDTTDWYVRIIRKYLLYQVSCSPLVRTWYRHDLLCAPKPCILVACTRKYFSVWVKKATLFQRPAGSDGRRARTEQRIHGEESNETARCGCSSSRWPRMHTAWSAFSRQGGCPALNSNY